MYTPMNWQSINAYTGTYSPNTIKTRNNRSFRYWERSLFERVWSVLEFHFPEDWSVERQNLAKYCILRFGYVMIANVNEYGLVAQPVTLSGYNIDYSFTNAILTNPAIKNSKTFTIGKDCEIVKLTPTFEGIYEIVDYYAGKLSQLDASIDMSIKNSRFAWMLGAKNKSTAQALKKMLDLINQGETAVIYDKTIEDDVRTENTPFQFLPFGDLKNNYILTDLLQDFNTILNNFDNEIGIASVPFEKKERLVTAEAESKSADAEARLTVWLESLNDCFEKVNAMFGTNMSVEKRNGGEDDGNNDNDNDWTGELDASEQ